MWSGCGRFGRCRQVADASQMPADYKYYIPAISPLEPQALTLPNISATVNIAFHLRNLAALPPNLTLGLVSLVSPPYDCRTSRCLSYSLSLNALVSRLLFYYLLLCSSNYRVRLRVYLLNTNTYLPSSLQHNSP